MNNNSRYILDRALQQKRQRVAPELSEQDYFERFCAEQILKNFPLTDDEIQAGIVDGEHDGGIDSAYAFVNSELVREDFDTSAFKSHVHIELHLIQSKTSGGFSEAPVNCFISATRNLLNLQADYSNLTQYNESVKDVLNSFRKTYSDLASKFPRLKIRYYYASKSAAANISPNLERKRDELIGVAKELFPNKNDDVAMEFLGARRLLDLAGTLPQTTHSLTVKKNLSDTNAYVVLTSLSSYTSFIKDSEGKIRQDLFESNVRDFQGSTEVNNDIATTLQQETIVDFWWMNNGVTILANKITLSGDVITMENPQIVNGLQTSKQIAEHSGLDPDNQSIMVKILSSEDDETRDKIIKATNSQNRIQPASLCATDQVQRDIEYALKPVNLYYDRRKNYYKNQGKPRTRIIGIPLMAQAIMSIILAQPNSARARPSSLIKTTDYSNIFSDQYPILLYSNAADFLRRTQNVLSNRSEMTRRDRTNLRFYVLYWLVASATRSDKPTPEQVARLRLDQVTDDDIEAAIDAVYPYFNQLGGDDNVAKGGALILSLRNILKLSFTDA